MNRIRRLIPAIFLIILTAGCQSIDEHIDKGQFDMAKKKINKKIASGTLAPSRRIELENKKELMHRIEMDFNKTREDILPYIEQYYPDVSNEQIRSWEEEKALEYMIINGEKRYFARAVQNLFRINKEAKARKQKIEGKQKDNLDRFLESYIPPLIKDLKDKEKTTGKEHEMKFTFTLTVDADAVPDGEVIRCWLPFPREGNIRQEDVKFLSAGCDNYVLASNDLLQRTLYMQKPATAGEPTVFETAFSTSTKAQWIDLKSADIKPYDKSTELYRHFTAERSPHLLFTQKIKEMSEKIVGDEKDPYLIARKIFKYINDNYPWASAREYSTIENIPEYVIENKHGDCGQVTLLFMVLARYNGIPARWQSGWMLHPGSKNLHDWCEIYFEGIGWVPVDQSFGLVESDDEDVHWFFLGGMDAYRLIVNDDYARTLFPAKNYMRSETNDFQRGEVEWRGGNLYFDQWDYHLEIEYVNPKERKF
ncbi:MAG: transglutaminase-like domain-containing protein [Candidatus Marinimicrobia bacterium]|nr:transglutaminase-like domain-containing protein [Candidatus Neomarinimicrobiota bacterium]